MIDFYQGKAKGGDQSFIKKVIDVPAEPPRKSGPLKAEWMGKACWEKEAE